MQYISFSLSGIPELVVPIRHTFHPILINQLFYSISLYVFPGILQVVYGGGGGPVYSTSLETELRKEIFTTNSYEVLQRPQETVVVKISLTILTVNDLVNKSYLI